MSQVTSSLEPYELCLCRKRLRRFYIGCVQKSCRIVTPVSVVNPGIWIAAVADGLCCTIPITGSSRASVAWIQPRGVQRAADSCLQPERA